MAEQDKHDHRHDHDHHQGDHKHEDQHDHSHGQHRAHDHSDHGHARDHEHSTIAVIPTSGHSHGHDHKTRFHDPAHAAEFDRRSTMEGIRGSLTIKMIEMLALSGNEWVLDLATGTGRVARPVSKHIKTGRIVGVDQALAMLDVGHQHQEPISSYSQAAGAADALPLKSNSFDRAFVSFSLHHFGNPPGVVKEVMRVLKGNGRFVVLDPIIEEAKDAVDAALEAKNQSGFPAHARPGVSLSHREQHSTFAIQSRLSYSTHQYFVLLVQPGRNGRNPDRPSLVGSGA